jgi:signal transduction histidine kinase
MDYKSNEDDAGYHFLVAHLMQETQAIGILTLWASKRETFSRRRMMMFETLAQQAALLLEKHRLYRQVEFRAGLEERARLAREIHDGLAQTLGFLKLRMAQLQSWLHTDREADIQPAFEELLELLDDAYVDAREAIDGLRLQPISNQLSTWVDQVVAEFRDLSSIELQVARSPNVTLPPEVLAQLMRIIQESLSNVRKHSRAGLAEMEWELDHGQLVFLIRDHGCGFEACELASASRHGLRIMEERARLIEAQFQVISQPGEGTTVEVRMPLQEMAGDVIR